MRTYKNLELARYGLYLSVRPPDVRFVGNEGEALEGRPGARYVRLPTLLVAALGPVLGGMFVMAFPFIVVSAIAAALGSLAIGKLRSVAAEHAYLMRLGWEPGAAYLRKLERPTGTETVAKGEHELDELAKEVAERRHDEPKA